MSVEAVSNFLEPFTGTGDGFLAITKATRSEDPEHNKKWESHTLSNLYLQVNGGDFALPREVLEDNPEAEFYFTPAVFDDEYRREAHFKYSNALWVDFDQAVNWQALDPLPSIVVQTSESEKVHCYWLLQDTITDANDLRYWNKRLQEGYGEGADPSGYDAAQLLKLPYGRNLKLANRDEFGKYFEPKVLKFNPDLKYAESHFNHLPEPNAPSVSVDLTEIGSAPVTDKSWEAYLDEYNVPSEIQVKILRAQEGGEEKRSGALYSLESALFDSEFEARQVFHLLWKSPNDKFTADFGEKMGAHRLWQDICRVQKKREAAQASSENAEEEIAVILNSKLSYSDKGREINNVVQRKLSEVGEFIQTDEGEYFYVDKRTDTPHMFRVENNLTGAFAGLLVTRFGINPGVDRSILQGAMLHCLYKCQATKKIKLHYFAHYSQERNVVYVNRNDGTMYKLDGTSVVRAPQGEDGVYFRSNPEEAYPKPFTYSSDYTKGGLDALILTGPNYTEAGDNITKRHMKHILLTWISTFFFPTMMNTRPIVLFHGEADSGKSSFFQNLSLVFSGNHTHAVVEMPKDVKDFNVQVCKNSYIFYDNVEVNEKRMQEKLAQVATGFSVRERRLHTNNDMSIMTARAFVGITSRTIDKIQKDVAQRYIIIPVHPYMIDTARNQGRKSMSQILKEVTTNRDKLFSEILDFVNRIVKQIDKNGLASPTSDKIRMRMADYAQFLHLTAGLVGLSGPELESYIERKQAETLDENDSMIRALKLLAKQTGNDPKKRWRISELYQDLRLIDRKFVREYPSQRKFSSALKANMNGGQLLHNGINATTTTSGNATRYSITYIEDEGTEEE